MVDLVSTGKGSMFDAQTTSSGPAGAPRYLMADGRPGVKGVPLFDLPDCAKGEPDRSEEYMAFVMRRTEWVYEVQKKGGRIFECRLCLIQAGHNVTDAALSRKQQEYEQELREPSRPTAPILSEPEAETVEEVLAEAVEVIEDDLQNASPETLRIVSEMIDRAVGEQRAMLELEMEQLAAKVEKWRKVCALRDLIPE